MEFYTGFPVGLFHQYRWKQFAGSASLNSSSEGPRRRGLSKSVAKAPIAPKRRKRIVDIPRFFSPPIPPRGAFATDSDTPPPRIATGAPPAPARQRPATTNPSKDRRRPASGPSSLIIRVHRSEYRCPEPEYQAPGPGRRAAGEGSGVGAAAIRRRGAAGGRTVGADEKERYAVPPVFPAGAAFGAGERAGFRISS